MNIPRWSRVQYPVTLAFSTATSLSLYGALVALFAGLFAFNWVTQAKSRVCTSYDTPVYGDSGNTCSPAPLVFSQSYFTTPIRDNTTRTTVSNTGLFPWKVLAFGDGRDVPFIDYGVLQANYTGQPLQCSFYYVGIRIDLPDQIVGGGCAYCGPNLRILCGIVDTTGAGLPPAAVIAFSGLTAAVKSLATAVQGLPSSALDGSDPLRLSVTSYSTISGLNPNTLPWEAEGNRTEVTIGTPRGLINITDSGDTALAGIATGATTLLNISKIAMEADLNGVGDNKRALLVSYRCDRCSLQYKRTAEIIAILISGIAAVLFPAFTIARILAERIAPNKHENRLFSEKEPSALIGYPPQRPVSGEPTYATDAKDRSAAHSQGVQAQAGSSSPYPSPGIALAQQPLLFNQR